jgi:hypothetical protein
MTLVRGESGAFNDFSGLPLVCSNEPGYIILKSHRLVIHGPDPQVPEVQR